MEVIRFDDMKKTWHQIARYRDEEMDISFELAVHRSLLETFHVGQYYYYIVNLAKVEIEFVSDNVTTVIGLASPDLFTVEFIYENIHPDDRSRFIAHERKVTEFFNNLPPEKVLKYKVSYDYRLKRADGSYVWILMQTVTIQTSDDGAVIRVLGVQTDISHLKQDNTPCGLSFFGLDGEPSFLNVDVPEFIQIRENELFSVREREILRLMVEGKTSRQIADQLFLSLHTVNTHRKNILAKSDCRNIPELLVKAVRKGWAS